MLRPANHFLSLAPQAKMVKPIDSDSVVLIKENKKGEDAWSVCSSPPL